MSKFGPFATAFLPGFNSASAYLELLGMHPTSQKTQTAITCIETALAEGDSARWIALLLGETNWRPNLVGAVALILDPGAADSALVWGAIDRESWVVPQLVITAAIIDPMFRARMHERVAAATSPKLLASMLAVCAELPDLAEWRAGVLREERVIALLARDFDKSDDIVASWLRDLRVAFTTRGRSVRLG